MINIAIISIFLISGAVIIIRKIWPSFTFCPICAGVFGTWLWILVGIWIGWLTADSWESIAALAMGGSVVGITDKLASRVSVGRELAWKIFFIPAGFAAAYGLILSSWLMVILSLVVICFLLRIFISDFWRISVKNKSGKIAYLEKKMKDCC